MQFRALLYSFPLLFLLFTTTTHADSLKASVERLNSIKEAPIKSEADGKLLKALSIIDRMEEKKKWVEARKLVDLEELRTSRYAGDLLYILFCHAANSKNVNEMKTLGDRVDHYGVHGFAVLLTRTLAMQDLKMLGYNAESSRVILDYIETLPVTNVIHGPMTVGNVLFGFTVPEDYSHHLPKVHSVKQYLESAHVLSGFTDANSYKALLEEAVKSGAFSASRVEKLGSLCEKEGAPRKAAEQYKRMAKYHVRQGQPEIAAGFIRKAARLDRSDKEINQLKQEIELSLVLASQKAAAQVPAAVQPSPAAAVQPAEPAHAEEPQKHDDCDNTFFFASDQHLTPADLAGKGKNELRLMRNEIYARHGRVFTTQDLNDYFGKKCWYAPNTSYSDSTLSTVELQNIALLKGAEAN